MKSNTYWENRSNEVMASSHKSSDKYIAEINKAYNKAQKDLQTDIRKIFNTYANGHNLTPSESKFILNTRIPNFLREILKRVYKRLEDGKAKDWILAELNSNAYRARITRLEAIKQCAKIRCMEVYNTEIEMTKKSYVFTVKKAYYETIYNVQKGVNIAFNVAQINDRAIDMLLKTNWSGKNYSARVWNNTNALSARLTETITSGFISGKSLSKVAKELEDLTDLGQFACERLVRTETTYFNNQAALKGYEEVGIDKYVYIATLDLKTSEVCKNLDNKTYNVKDQKAGVNCPPMHPFCRSAIGAYINDEYLKRSKRRAKDVVTGKSELIDNMSYKEWYDKYV